MYHYRIPYQELVETLKEILLQYDLKVDRADLCATLFAKASLDGVASHGINRFPSFLNLIKKKYIQVNAQPEKIGEFGGFERWDGKLGPGNLNAYFAMERAIGLAKKKGMGCVALKNTNHWMRGGNYGWQAVENQCIGLCCTNAKPNMPAWGSDEPRLGNNPLVIAVPRKEAPIVLDMAMTQFSYGRMDTFVKNNEELPYDGGFDKDGNITRDPAEILENELALPIGLWKGAGLSLLIDIISSVLSEGEATYQIGGQEEEYGLSQFFLCFYPPKLGLETSFEDKIEEIIVNLKRSSAIDGHEVRYPGEATLTRREKNLELGVPVDEDIWEIILKLKKGHK